MVLHLILLTALVQAVSVPAQAPPFGACVPEPGTDRLTFQDFSGTPPLASSLAVWSGEELIFADGSGQRFRWNAYAPANDQWRALFDAGWMGRVAGDETRQGATLVWAAGKAVLWGGTSVSPSLSGGLALDPVTDLARPISDAGAPSGRSGHWAVAVGSRMFVWGGMSGQTRLCDGAAYDPEDNRWAPMAPAPAEVCASVPRVVTGAQGRLVVLADRSPASVLAATYDALTNGWALADPRGAPHAIEGAAVLPNGALYVSEPSLTSPAPVSLAEPSRGDRQSIYVFDARSGRWTKRGEACAGRLMPLGEDLLQLGGPGRGISCLLEPAAGRCTELVMFQWRPADPIISIADGVLLRLGTATPAYPPPSVVMFLRRQGSVRFHRGLMVAARTAHTATLLPTHEVLVAGGATGDPVRLSSAELYDPASGTWSETGPMSIGRLRHTATLLTSGKVLVVGGLDRFDPWGIYGMPLAQAEVYDLTSDTWSPAGSLARARAGHTATLLRSGEVLVVGGDSGAALRAPELYDPVRQMSVPAGSIAAGRGHSATLLASGNVLICGGFSDPSSCQLFDAQSRTWRRTGSLLSVRVDHTATLLDDERVLVVGGNPGNNGGLASAELYDPATETWTPAAPLATPRFGHTATKLPSGEVLVAGGFNGLAGGELSSVEIFDPKRGTWSTGSPMLTRRRGHTATLLAAGGVLVSGGQTRDGVALSKTEEFDPQTGQWTRPGAAVASRDIRRSTWASRANSRVRRHGNVRGMAAMVSEPWGGAYRRFSESSISPAVRQRLLFRNGERNSETKPVAAVTTDELGLFGLDLPPGTYCLIQPAALHPPPPGLRHFEPHCLQQAWRKCAQRFRVPEARGAVVVVHVTFTQGRPACYVGPEPP